MTWIATWAFAKNYSYEDVKYCDDMYGHEGQVGEVWEYMEEIRNTGKSEFYQKYSEYKLY